MRYINLRFFTYLLTYLLTRSVVVLGFGRRTLKTCSAVRCGKIMCKPIIMITERLTDVSLADYLRIITGL